MIVGVLGGCSSFPKCYGNEKQASTIEAESKTKAALKLAELQRTRTKEREAKERDKQTQSRESETVQAIEKRIANDYEVMNQAINEAFKKQTPLVVWVAMIADESIVRGLQNWAPVYASVSQNGGDSSPRVLIIVPELSKAVLTVKKSDIDRKTPWEMIETYQSAMSARSRAKDGFETSVPGSGTPGYSTIKTVPLTVPAMPVFRTVPFSNPGSGFPGSGGRVVSGGG